MRHTASFVKYEIFSEHLSEKVHDLNADTLKVALSNAAPNGSTHEVLGDVAELAAGGGYTAGGADTQNATSRTTGVTSIVGTDVVFTGSGAGFGPFRYVILYNDTPAAPEDPLIGFWDIGEEITLGDAETFTVNFGAEMFTVQ